jgi:uncharacterized protein
MPGAACEWPEFPFCGKRCKLIDIGRWLGESYSITAADQEPERDETDGESEEY